MIKKYPELAPSGEFKTAPKSETINAILNYSKSLEVKQSGSKKKKVLIHLN